MKVTAATIRTSLFWATSCTRKTLAPRSSASTFVAIVPGTIATNVIALERGASIFRVHDVREIADALKVAVATVGAR